MKNKKKNERNEGKLTLVGFSISGKEETEWLVINVALKSSSLNPYIKSMFLRGMSVCAFVK